LGRFKEALPIGQAYAARGHFRTIRNRLGPVKRPTL
jgi:hypothetical protein